MLQVSNCSGQCSNWITRQRDNANAFKYGITLLKSLSFNEPDCREFESLNGRKIPLRYVKVVF